MKFKWFSICTVGVYALSSGCVFGAETVNTAKPNAGFVCVPDKSGSGWLCEEDRGQKPERDLRTLANTIEQAKRPIDEHEGAEVDPVTGISVDPADWYTPTLPRPILATHKMFADVSAHYYVRQQESGFCPGGYQQRAFPHPLNSAAESFAIVAEADSLAAELDVAAHFQGNVTIEQGNRLIVAPNAVIDYPRRAVHFNDGVRMDEPGVVMQGDTATVFLDSSRADLVGVQFLLANASLRGDAQTMTQDENGNLVLTENDFTRCEPGNNGWRLNTQSLEIEEGAVFGTAKHAVLRLKSVPIFYTPYLKFPISDERVSGFLFPTFAYSDEDGVDVSIPYYFNIAPNYDATLIPRYISQRGAAGELELRHLNSWQTTILSGAMLPSDNLFNGGLSREDFDEAGGEAILGEFERADRWLGAIDHKGRIGAFRTIIDYTSVSDRDYFRDLGSDLGVSSRLELERRGEVQYASGGLFMRLWAQRFQRLDEVHIDEYQRLPELDLSYSKSLVGPLSLNFGAKWSEFDRDTDGLNGLAAVTGSRTHIEPRLRMNLSRSYGFLNASAGIRYTAYNLEQDSAALGVQLIDDTPDRNIGIADLDAGLFFERELNWFGQELIQTLEPRLYYLWQEFDAQENLPSFDASKLTFGYSQLFRDNRFSGVDRFGDTQQISAGLTSRFISSDTGREYFRYSIGEIFYFDDREVTLAGAAGVDEQQSSSAIASEVSAAIAQHWRFTGSIVWDPHDNKVDEGGVAIQYQSDNRHIVNVGFRNRFDQDIEQTDLSLYWPVTKHIAIMGRWNYDLVSGRTIEGFGGLEYSDCCLQVRLVARHFLDSPSAANFENIDSDDGVFLQVVFKGLAGFGTRVESVLERGIRGYRSPEQRDYFNE